MNVPAPVPPSATARSVIPVTVPPAIVAVVMVAASKLAEEPVNSEPETLVANKLSVTLRFPVEPLICEPPILPTIISELPLKTPAVDKFPVDVIVESKVAAPATDNISSIVVVPPALSIVRFPPDVSISPAAVTPTCTLSAVTPANVGLASVVTSWLIVEFASIVIVFTPSVLFCPMVVP